MKKILVVEDDKNILSGLVDNLEMEGYSAVIARDGKEALRQVKERKPDLIILDIMLPKLGGFEVCKELKSSGNRVPIIILSARAQETDKVLGLELGADDYVTKPFSPRELMVRVKAVLRRAEGASGLRDTYEFGGVTVDFKKMQVFKQGADPSLRGGAEGGRSPAASASGGWRDPAMRKQRRGNLKEIKLTPAEFKLLKLLISADGAPVSRHKLLSEIWTSEEVTTRTVDTHIWNLRSKLEADPENPVHFVTVHRIGYKFVG